MGFLLSKFGLYLGLAIALIVGHQAYKVHYVNKGKAVVVEASKIEGEKANARTKKRTDAIKPSDASKRLFSNYSRR